MAVGETYTGIFWVLASEEVALPVQTGQALSLPTILTRYREYDTRVQIFPVVPQGPGPVPISLYATKLEGSDSFQFRSYSRLLETPQPLRSWYGWQPRAPVIKYEDPRNLRAVAVSDTLLQLPEDLPSRVVDLAAEITRDKESHYEKLEAIRQYLWENYDYDLNNAATPPGQDAVDFLLFEDKRGVSTTFSSAFVVLARSTGIPARVVGGWVISPTR